MTQKQDQDQQQEQGPQVTYYLEYPHDPTMNITLLTEMDYYYDGNPIHFQYERVMVPSAMFATVDDLEQYVRNINWYRKGTHQYIQ